MHVKWSRSPPNELVWSPDPTSWPYAFLLDISVIWEDRALIFSGSIEYEMPNMMWYELKVTIGQKLPKKTEMNKNEQKMNKFLCHFGKILEWLMKGSHFRKIHCLNDKATISLNVWVTTFGPPCTYLFPFLSALHFWLLDLVQLVCDD